MQQRTPLVGSGLEETRTQVPILKFLDSHNEDGSYTYGYEVRTIPFSYG